MKKAELNKIMQKAQAVCEQSGVRLTEKRKAILEVLVNSRSPLSAYQIADICNEKNETSMPAMSVYRILDFLESEQLTHKLSSTNKYVACAHIACDHGHEIPQFLICTKCLAVKEVGIKKAIIEELNKQASKVGYQLISSQLELDCICDTCLQKK